MAEGRSKVTVLCPMRHYQKNGRIKIVTYEMFLEMRNNSITWSKSCPECGYKFENIKALKNCVLKGVRHRENYESRGDFQREVDRNFERLKRGGKRNKGQENRNGEGDL